MARPTLRSLAVLGLGASLLAACSTGPSGGATAEADPAGDPGTATSEAPADAFPVTLEHSFGETTIESDPQRIATVGWGDQDILLALGEVPVGATRITWGGNEGGSTDWFDAEIAEMGGSPADVTRYDDSDGIPFDEIAALTPDLILGTNSGLTEEDYDRLAKIAPVVPHPELAWGTPWQDSVELVGQAIGREDEAATVRAETEELIDEAVAAYPEIEGKSMAWAWFTPSDLSTVGLYTSIDLRPQLMREFGMVDADLITELSEGSDLFSVNLSAEQADTLDADLLFAYVDGEAQVDTFAADPLLGQIPALADGSYVVTADQPLVTAMTSPTPLSIPVVLEEFLPLAGEAAAQAR